MQKYAHVVFTLMIAGTAFGQGKDQGVLWEPRPLMSGEVPMPDRIVRSDIVVLGSVVALEPTDVQAVLSSAHHYKLDYRIAVVKVQEVIHGQKDVRELRLGFISPDQDRAVDKTGKNMPGLGNADFRPVKVGQDGLFFLKKHHQGGFYVNFVSFSGFLPRSDAPEFTKNLENARRLSKVLERPLEALKAENALNRFLAATMLISHYRLSGAKVGKREKAIDAEESKLLLTTLAEADWKDVKEAISSSTYPPHPYQVFLQLGVTKTDGYEPPTFEKHKDATLGYTQRWLRDNQGKYRIQRFSQPDGEKKAKQGVDAPAEKKEAARASSTFLNAFCATFGPNLAEEPLTFEFKRKSGPAKGRKEAFDVRTQAYYLHVEDIARFEVKAVTPDVQKRAFVLKITGMLDTPEGPLTLIVPEKGGKNKEFKLHHQGFDKELFRIERKDGETTIEFLPKGRELLRPGVSFQYVDVYRN